MARNESRNELTQLQEKNADLEQKINILSTDYGLDQEIKAQYRVVRPGEEIVIIVDNDESVGEPEDTETFWDKLRSFIGL
jgi:cell division protein FtsB